jgi:flagellar hook protein FlgE
MMRSLYSGVSGLRNHQTRMDVIANNIANVNTAGFKSSRVVFQDIYSQTSRNASAAMVDGEENTIMGGTNPMQIGLGVVTAAIDVLHTSAAITRTDNPLDLMIQGDGFFQVLQSDGSIQYTRAGNFYLDHLGNLVTTGGNPVLGYMTGALNDDGEWESDEIDEFTGDLLPDINEEIMTTLAEGGDPDGPAKMIDLISEDGDPDHYRGINLYNLRNISIDDKGKIWAMDSTNEKKVVGLVILANFVNPTGLEKKGNSQYAQSANSGGAVSNLAQTNAAGAINPGGLEMSNVDLANEFTDMIITQRGFQANSRIITVSDSMLEELVNLKR